MNNWSTMVTAKRHETLSINKILYRAYIRTFFFFSITNSRRREKETHSKACLFCDQIINQKNALLIKKEVKWNWKERAERETKWLIKLDISINNFFLSLLTSYEDHPSNSLAHLHFVYNIIKKICEFIQLCFGMFNFISHTMRIY